MNLIQILQRRRTTKAYDASRTLPADVVASLLAALRWSPSSVNSQPWHFIVADDAAGKARIATSATAPYAYNAPKITDASHVVVLCARETLTSEHLDAVLAQEHADGRFVDDAAREGQRKGRDGYVNQHRHAGDTAHWLEKQTYIALGFLLLSAATLGVDATPMEGFDPQVLDAEFGLGARGLVPLVIVSLGHHVDADFNARLPKSRLPEDRVFSRA